ncbi:MAG TPA: hypothetical protein VFM23_03515, partial [Gemmatimonadales bacterium]|nr:hypothetical protein [Gemmatimonadales bacterium]
MRRHPAYQGESVISPLRSLLPVAVSLFATFAVPSNVVAQGPCDQIDPPPPPWCFPAEVSVTPDNGTAPTRVPNTGGYTAVFNVSITSGMDTWTFVCSSSGNVTCGVVGPKSAALFQGEALNVTVSYSVGNAGSGTLTLTAISPSSSDAGSFTVPIGQAAGAPIVDVTPYNFDKQDYRRCALACFATIYTQSTVPYFSLNTPRSVTLIYNSDRVNPRPFVHVNVTPDLSTGTPLEYRFQVKVNGAFVTFLNGETLLRFAYPGNVKVRLGGQFDASSYATGVYPLDIIVAALYPGSVRKTTTIPTKLAVVNETNAAVARGWTLAGIQRLYLQIDGSALITEGDGSATYFWNVGGTFQTPRGDFSALTSGGGYTRSFVDGTQILFDATGKMTQVRDR